MKHKLLLVLAIGIVIGAFVVLWIPFAWSYTQDWYGYNWQEALAKIADTLEDVWSDDNDRLTTTVTGALPAPSIRFAASASADGCDVEEDAITTTSQAVALSASTTYWMSVDTVPLWCRTGDATTCSDLGFVTTTTTGFYFPVGSYRFVTVAADDCVACIAAAGTGRICLVAE